MPKLFQSPQVLMWFFEDISIKVLQLRNIKTISPASSKKIYFLMS